MIPFTAFDDGRVEEKPEPDYYICKDGFDSQTGGRFLSAQEKQIARRLEFYERYRESERLGTVLQDSSQAIDSKGSGEERREKRARKGAQTAWFGVALGCD